MIERNQHSNNPTGVLSAAASIVALAAVYFLAGKFGLSLAFVHASASAVWPPTGIALAALLLWGDRFWPGIFLGAFLVNITTHGSVATTLGITIGNTLEALAGAWLIDRFANGAKAFEQTRSIFKFVLLAVPSTLVSATLGVTSLTLGGFSHSEQYYTIWFTWWLGDMAGALTVTPLLLIWLKQPYPQLKITQLSEAAGLLLSVILVGRVIFLGVIPSGMEYIATLPLLWAAFRFGQHGAATSVFVMSGFASAGALQGIGPFVTEDPNKSLLLVQVFMATITVAALALASVVAERKRAEEALRSKESQLRAVTDITPVLLTQCSRDLRYTFVNNATAELLARPPEQIVGKPIAEVIGSEAYDIIRPYIETVLQGRPVEYEAEIPYKEVGKRFMRVTYTPDKDDKGGVRGWIASMMDVTDRKRAEEARARLAAIVDSSEDVIISKDLNGVILSWNPAAKRLFGYTAEEIVGKPAMVLIPRDRHDEEQRILDCIRRGQSVEPYDTVRRRKDGTLVEVSLVVSPIKDANGNVIGASKIARDITRRKRAELALRQARDQLAKSNEELEKRVQERTTELEQANAALMREMEEEKKLKEQLLQAQKMESIGTLAGGIAHDFNNILNIILGYASLLGQVAKDPAKVSENAEVIKEMVKRGASVVQQLFSIGRKAEIKLEQVDINPLLEQLKTLLLETFPRTIEVSLQLEPNIPRIMADPNQINQVVLNMCLNAQDAMPTGGKLLIETRTVSGDKLRESFQDITGRGYLCITVTDTGLGMDETTKSRIFEPFFTTKGHGKGTGLGLSVAYGIISNHGGIIDIISEPDHGSTFHIYLPIPEDETRPFEFQPYKPKPAENLRLRRETILFVEDELQQLHLMQTSLENEGYRVLVAEDGVKAVELHRRHENEIRLVVLDLNLPNLNGWEAFQIMKKSNPSVKAIIASAVIPHYIETELAKGKLSGLIRKPYELDDVLDKINRALHEAEERSMASQS